MVPERDGHEAREGRHGRDGGRERAYAGATVRERTPLSSALPRERTLSGATARPRTRLDQP
ncbi:hypothetical protein PV398_48130, partial [Streptomyces ipomoeae]|nr:hypothetical protein [Streptomyces ipomoeae]